MTIEFVDTVFLSGEKSSHLFYFPKLGLQIKEICNSDLTLYFSG